MIKLAFQRADVFTAVPFKGKPVAVVLDADAVPDEQMQLVVRWTNLSQTTFVCRPTLADADCRLRIFTPRGNCRSPGKSTIGSAHAALRHGVEPRSPGRMVQQCGRGLVPLRIDAGRVSFELPTAVHREATPEQIAAVTDALGVARGDVLRAEVVDVGAVWFTVQLPDAARVLALRPEMGKLSVLKPTRLTGLTVSGDMRRTRQRRSQFDRSRRPMACPRTRSAAAATDAWRPFSDASG